MSALPWPRRALSMQWRMTIAISAVFVAAILAFGWMSLGNVRRGYEQAGEYQLALTQRVGADIDGTLDSSLNAIDAMGRSLTPPVYGSAELADRWLGAQPAVRAAFFDAGLFLFDAHGRLIAASSHLPSLGERAELGRWVALALKLDEPLIGLPFRSGVAAGKLAATLLLPVAAPYYAPDGGIAGVLVGVSDFAGEMMTRNALAARMGRSGYFFLTAWDGSLLAHPDGRMLLRRDVAPVPADIVKAATHGARGPVETVDHAGAPVLATFVKMQATGWVLGANQPTREAFAQVDKQKRDILLFMILGSLAIADAAWLLMRAFVKPIERLAEQIGEVDVAADVILDPISVPRESIEAARLGRSFNELIARLNVDREQSHIADSVFMNVREGIVVTDRNARIVSCNHAFEDITGYAFAEVRGRTCAILKSGRQDTEFYRQMWQDLMASGSWRGEIWNRRKNGDIYPELLNISAALDDDGNVDYYVGIFSDISETVRQQQRLETLATTDPLTGLPNRALLADRLNQCVAQARRLGHVLGVAYVDLDGFKQVNDREGHHVGDRMLIEAADRFRRAARLGDTVARLGGDEFVLLLSDVDDQDQALRTLERILEAISAPYHVDGRVLNIAASVGVAFFPADDVEPDILLRHADHAMYQAKSLGRARIHVFDPAFDRDVRSRQELVEEIREGIRNGELELHYQPKVDMRSREVVGVEALLRWRHPSRGLLYPGQFIDEVATHDVVIDIGEWVVAEACRQVERWLAESGRQIPVSVNLAARHLVQEGFVESLRAALAKHPTLRPEWIEIEILESDTLHDLSRIERTIQECQAMGIKFALDDFGTGYSSLSHLKNIPVDALKIDRSFVINMLSAADDLAIVEGVVRLAYVFRRNVIAEGVETQQHIEMLCNMGCYRGQGYGISRPIAAAEVVPWIERYSTGADGAAPIRLSA